MTIKKTRISIATTMALGLAAGYNTASAVAIAPGDYSMTIQVTPEAYPNTGIPDVGTDGSGPGAGARNSSFSFNALPSFSSQSMTDNAIILGGFGSSIGGDGVAGTIGLTSDGSNLTFTSFNVDVIQGTAGGNFAQEGGTLGTWTGTTGATTTFTPTGRLGGIDGTGLFIDNPWNYKIFSDSSSTNNNGTVNGTSVTAVPDTNGDGLQDYTAVFVSAGEVGAEWGTFNGAQYIEVWKVEINSVPVPAAVWLFGSGLVGLVGVARRRQKSA